MTKPTLPEVEAAIAMVPDDLPDGAYWMMAHELLGLDYGDLFPLMDEYGMLESEKDAEE